MAHDIPLPPLTVAPWHGIEFPNINRKRALPMDPNFTLASLLHDVWLLSQLDVNDGTDQSLVDLTARVAENVTALNGWLVNGGFLPDAWRKPIVPDYGVNPLIDQMLWDVFVTALEGGINDWAACEGYQCFKDDRNTNNLDGFFADIIDAEYEKGDADAEFPPTRINRAIMARAFDRVAVGPVEGWHESYRGKFLVMLQSRLVGMDVDVDFDAYDAQALVQVGLLGSVIFG
jgi:hypothetical protein